MRRQLLLPPRPVPVALPGAIADDRGAPPRRVALASPRPARTRLRRLFDPARGWFRRAERGGSHWLSLNVFPRIPGLRLLYDTQLRAGLTLGEATVTLRGLDPRLDGLRVLLVSDVHAGPFVSVGALDRAFERLMSSRPDVVLLAGDLTTARAGEFDEAAEAFSRLRAPLGVWAVLGNHDHYGGGPERVRASLDRSGIGVLHNRCVRLMRDGATLWLAGIDDLLVGEPDLDAALREAQRPVVLLSHNPDAVFEAARRGVDLVVSGHTHAGQIRLPGLPVIVRQSRYRLDEGRFRHGSAELIVSRGLGVVGVPLRLSCPPEAVLLTLRPASERREPAGS